MEFKDFCHHVRKDLENKEGVHRNRATDGGRATLKLHRKKTVRGGGEDDAKEMRTADVEETARRALNEMAKYWSVGMLKDKTRAMRDAHREVATRRDTMEETDQRYSEQPRGTPEGEKKAKQLHRISAAAFMEHDRSKARRHHIRKDTREAFNDEVLNLLSVDKELRSLIPPGTVPPRVSDHAIGLRMSADRHAAKDLKDEFGPV